ALYDCRISLRCGDVSRYRCAGGSTEPRVAIARLRNRRRSVELSAGDRSVGDGCGRNAPAFDASDRSAQVSGDITHDVPSTYPSARKTNRGIDGINRNSFAGRCRLDVDGASIDSANVKTCVRGANSAKY